MNESIKVRAREQRLASLAGKYPLLWPPNVVRRIVQAMLRAHLEAEISRLDWHIEVEERRIDEWPAREKVWRVERARLATRLDRLRGIGDRVKYLNKTE